MKRGSPLQILHAFAWLDPIQIFFWWRNGLDVYSSSPGSGPWLREQDLQSQRDLEVKASVIER